jgi:hypothetical protein
MRLSPVTDRTDSPAYPRRQRRGISRRWLTKMLATVLATVSLSVMACDGRLPFGPGEEVAGMMEEPWPDFYFVCDDEQPEYFDTSMSAPGTFSGNLCGEQSAWSNFNVSEQGVYQLELASGVERATAALISPDGEHVAQLDADRTLVNVELGPGLWSVAVDALDPVGDGYGSFSISLNRLGE